MSKTVKFWRFKKGQTGQPNDLLALKTGDSSEYDDGPIKARIKAVEDTTAELKGDYAQQIELLKAVRDALKGGDVPGAIGLLDTYLLDKEVLA